MSSRILCLLGLLLSLSVQTLAYSDYQEQLNLQPLPLGALRASFEFRSNESLSAFENQNFRFFPRSLGQILQHASTKELHLRFSSGRWNTETWGARPWHGYKEGATGVELWAWIDASSEEESFQKWTTLTQSLSGLFCASLNFIDSTRTTRPVKSFNPQGDYKRGDGSLHLLHGILPGEVVCTENLTPFLKLLPCKGKAGIASLLDGHKVFDSSWQSMSIDVRPVCPRGADKCHVEIEQSIDMVLDIERAKRPHDNPIPRPVPNDQLKCDETKPYHSHDTCFPKEIPDETGWSINDVFGKKIPGACPLTDEEWKPVCIFTPHERTVFVPFGAFEIKSTVSTAAPAPYRCYHFRPDEEFNLEIPESQQAPGTLAQSLSHEPLRAERTITGHGAAKGGIRTVLTNPSSSNSVRVVYFESVPWYMRPFIHTLKAETSFNSSPNNTSSTRKAPSQQQKVIQQMFYRPAIDRKRGTQLELVLLLPPSSTVTLTYDFEKAILRYTEYPPDANRGFNVGPAVIKILGPNHSAHETYIRTTALLLSLPTPDFSMPYNVIILTSTVMALAFGSIFNLLVRRFVGADEVQPVSEKLRALGERVRGRLRAVAERFGSGAKEKGE